jgi:hypothetical protein
VDRPRVVPGEEAVRGDAAQLEPVIARDDLGDGDRAVGGQRRLSGIDGDGIAVGIGRGAVGDAGDPDRAGRVAGEPFAARGGRAR